jgi:flagellar biosynthetic protein FliR
MNHFHAIIEHMPAALLVIFRIGGLMIYGPVFGSSVIPARVRVFLAFIVGVAVYWIVSDGGRAAHALQLHLWLLPPLIAMELLIGLIVGYLASLPLIGLQTGGLIMGQQMGLGFAQLYNPAMDDEADILGQMLFFMALAGFLMLGGHEWMLLAVLHSFEHVPLGMGALAVGPDLIGLVTGVLLSSLELALRVAAPVLAMVFLETVAMGFLAKTVPQLNILSLGFPLRILVGIGTVAAGLVVINDVAIDLMNSTFDGFMAWIADQGDVTHG